jgi:hypothetical protein
VKTVLIHVRESTLEGTRPRRATCHRRSKPPSVRGGLPCGARPWRRGRLGGPRSCLALAQTFGSGYLLPCRQRGRSESKKRQEGIGAGNSARLHGWNKALKGEPQERSRHETRPASAGR